MLAEVIIYTNKTSSEASILSWRELLHDSSFNL